jgi:hypothetical protein
MGGSDLDTFRSKILQTAITVYFSNQGYGAIKEVIIESEKKQIVLQFYPEGEQEKMTITIGKYEQKRVDQKEFLILQNIQTNRLWLTRIFADHMKEGIKIPLHGGMGALPLILGL